MSHRPHRPPRPSDSQAVHEKRLANLAKANRVRARKAAVKAKLRSGELSLPEFVKKVPPAVRTAGVYEMLKEARGVGPYRAKKIMAEANLHPHASFSWMRGPAKERLLRAIAEVRPAHHSGRPRGSRAKVVA